MNFNCYIFNFGYITSTSLFQYFKLNQQIVLLRIKVQILYIDTVIRIWRFAREKDESYFIEMKYHSKWDIIAIKYPICCKFKGH